MTDTRLIVLTGATRGLGRALVDRFAEAGRTAAGCGRSTEHVAALREAFPPPHRFDAVDVSDAAAVAAWAGAVLDALGPPDLLINNAASMIAPAPLWEVPADAFGRLMDVNVDGTLNVIRAFAPAMIVRGSGVIVNFSSGWGRSTAPEVGPYCASKWAIEGLTRSLAAELPAGLAAVSLNPGIIDTDMLRTCWGSAAAAYPSPDAWSRTAAPLLLSLGPEHNGQAITAPQQPLP
ncbi:SDR family oxidoreductase [bacterium]|nr:SDR family oxidoreductase [bacterium]MBU1072039.1 SDR family oxidoreductase [bacterium]MBU1675189.1 SDR family oxidoreductase [bacterium]